MSFDPFVLLCQAHGLPLPETEVRFHPVRKWRFDYAWRAARVALEKDGGLFSGGRHVRGRGYTEDCAKGAEALLAGWHVFHASPQQLEDGTAIDWLRRAFEKCQNDRSGSGRER